MAIRSGHHGASRETCRRPDSRSRPSSNSSGPPPSSAFQKATVASASGVGADAAATPPPVPALMLPQRRRAQGKRGAWHHAWHRASLACRKAAVASEGSVFMNQPPSHMYRQSIIIKLILGLLWTITHLAISLLNLWSHLIYSLECYLISFGLLRKYQNLHLDRLKCLAIVIDSKEAKSTAKVKQLLHWLSSMGVKYVCLYDIEGVLKKSFEPSMNASRDGTIGEHFGTGANIKDLHCSQREMAIEGLSGSDGKEGIAKAGSLLCSTYFKGDTHGDGKRKPTFTEADMASALEVVGCGGPEPDLLLMYGPTRCHLGFPAWRLRYTEIMYMGPLKSMKYGAIVKALYNFSKKHQNYGK